MGPFHNQMARINNRRAVEKAMARLEPLRNDTGLLPPQGLFPATSTALTVLGAAGAGVRARHAIVHQLLAFYSVPDPDTGALFAMPVPNIPLTAAGSETLARKVVIFTNYISE